MPSSEQQPVSPADRRTPAAGRRNLRSLNLACLWGLAVLGLTASSGAQNPPDLARILADRQLWGDGFPAVLANLDLWRQVGESRVAITRQRVIGEQAHPSPAAAAPATAAMRALLGTPRARRRPSAAFRDLLRPEMREATRMWRVEAVELAEDDSTRLAWLIEGAPLLRPELTVQEVHRRLGPPESIRRQAVHTEKDSRPVVLELHSYAGGSAVFVETDLAPTPGRVDRVVLDLDAVDAVVFEEEP